MKKFRKEKQVIAIYANKYVIVYHNFNSDKVREFAKNNRAKLKKEGALKVITNTGLYEF